MSQRKVQCGVVLANEIKFRSQTVRSQGLTSDQLRQESGPYTRAKRSDVNQKKKKMMMMMMKKKKKKKKKEVTDVRERGKRVKRVKRVKMKESK